MTGTRATLSDGSLKEALRACRYAFWSLFVFSIAINVLLLTSPLYMMQVYDRVLSSRSLATLLLLTLLMLFAFFVMSALELVRSRLMLRISAWLDQRLAGEVLAANVTNALRGGERSAQGLRDLATFRSFLTGPGLFPVMDAPWVPLFIAVNFLLHPLLGWLSLAGAAILFSLALLNEVVTRRPLEATGAATRLALGRAEMSVRNAEVIETMGMMPALLRRWLQSNQETLRLQAKASGRAALINATSRFMRMSLQSLSLGVGAYLVIGHEATAGIMIGASIIMGRALAPVELAIGSWRGLISARSAFDRVRRLLAETPSEGERTRLPVPSGALTLDNVYFAPPGSSNFVIKGIGFSLQPGEVLGLIGPSAAGKTTLARLIVGAWTPQRGSVRLDGAELSQWDRAQLGRYIGYVPQDVELFAGTIRDNIARLGEGSDEAVIEAAKQACLHEMILDLPNGYDTEIGDGGALLSGGQRQRVALARALFGRPKLLMLDEPNSSLDTAGEAGLLQTLTALKRQGTTIVLTTHRVNLLGIADKILLLQSGAVAAFGAREDVMRRLIPAAPDSAGRRRSGELTRPQEAEPRQLQAERTAAPSGSVGQGEEVIQ